MSAGSSAWRGWPDLVADRVCGLEEIELERQHVRSPELLPEEHHIHPRSKPLPKDGLTSARSWCETCVKSLGLEDPYRRRRGGRDLPELQVDYMFMGRRGREGADLRASCDRHRVLGGDPS